MIYYYDCIKSNVIYLKVLFYIGFLYFVLCDCILGRVANDAIPQVNDHGSPVTNWLSSQVVT